MFSIFLLWLLVGRSGDRSDSMMLELQNGLPDSEGIMYKGPGKEQDWLVKSQDYGDALRGS
jgi:hypothetical protein